MSDYAKLALQAVFSEFSDYSDPLANPKIPDYEVRAEGFTARKLQILASGSETVRLDEFASIYQLVVKNLDGTNYVTATHRSAGNSSTDNIHRIGAGKFLVLPDVTPASHLILQANGAPCLVEIVIFGETP